MPENKEYADLKYAYDRLVATVREYIYAHNELDSVIEHEKYRALAGAVGMSPVPTRKDRRDRFVYGKK